MVKIDRYNGNLLAFAINALANERTVFGDTSSSDLLDDNVNADFLRGWGIVGVNDFPTRQDFNAVAFTLGQLLAYLHQIGVAEWNTSQEYHLNSLAMYQGSLYKSRINSNTGNTPPTSPPEDANWQIYDPRFVFNDGAAAYFHAYRDNILRSRFGTRFPNGDPNARTVMQNFVTDQELLLLDSGGINGAKYYDGSSLYDLMHEGTVETGGFLKVQVTSDINSDGSSGAFQSVFGSNPAVYGQTHHGQITEVAFGAAEVSTNVNYVRLTTGNADNMYVATLPQGQLANDYNIQIAPYPLTLPLGAVDRYANSYVRRYVSSNGQQGWSYTFLADGNNSGAQFVAHSVMIARKS